MDPNLNIKVVVLGAETVGKTSITKRFLENQFSSKYVSTVGSMTQSKCLELGQGRGIVKFNIWDTAGQERYRSLAKMYYQESDAALIVFDMTKPASFEAVEYWLTELKQQLSNTITLAIAGNKCDLLDEQRVVTETAQKFAEKEGAMFCLTSAQTGEGVNELFREIAEKVFAARKAGPVSLAC